VERRPVERVRGTQDSWSPEAQQLAAIRALLEETFGAFGYSRIDVPVLEPAELHLRKSGLEIIAKLYGFDDQGGRRLCLRPELTASVVRAFIGQPPARLPARLFSTGPVFRYERPSRGRYRQFTQSGVELIGADGPAADAEVIHLAMHALDALGLAEYQVTIGHVGILAELLTKLGLTGRIRTFLVESLEEARRRGVDVVRSRLAQLDPELFEQPAGHGRLAGRHDEAIVREAVAGFLAELGSEALGRRSESEVVERILRKLNPSSGSASVERALEFMRRLAAIRGQPAAALEQGRRLLQEYALAEAPLEQLARTAALLDEFGANLDRVQVDLGLGRGLQYYTGTVFEIDHAGLGSESQLCGGGRYDDLARALGARQPLPALGFAFGVERVRLALEAEGQVVSLPPPADVFVVAAAAEQVGYAARIAQALRGLGLRVHLEVTSRPLRAALTFAGKEGFARVAIVGEAEARAQTVRVRDMVGGEEHTLPLDAAGDLRKALL
jgi:histidyl-tRNA synthetase